MLTQYVMYQQSAGLSSADIVDIKQIRIMDTILQLNCMYSSILKYIIILHFISVDITNIL